MNGNNNETIIFFADSSRSRRSGAGGYRGQTEDGGKFILTITLIALVVGALCVIVSIL